MQSTALRKAVRKLYLRTLPRPTGGGVKSVSAQTQVRAPPLVTEVDGQHARLIFEHVERARPRRLLRHFVVRLPSFAWFCEERGPAAASAVERRRASGVPECNDDRDYILLSD